MIKFAIAAVPFLLLLPAAASAEEAPAQKSLASSLNVYAFPTAGQEPSQQSQDEAACYQWAVGNAGVDPFDLAKQTAETQEGVQEEQAKVADSSRGAGARGAVGGAAAGALIGEIASDDAGEGAAYGAAAGAVLSRRRAKKAEQQSQAAGAQQTSQTQAASDEQLGNFKKAFSVCLEGKQYLVKY
jgi:hypothetical protein